MTKRKMSAATEAGDDHAARPPDAADDELKAAEEERKADLVFLLGDAYECVRVLGAGGRLLRSKLGLRLPNFPGVLRDASLRDAAASDEDLVRAVEAESGRALGALSPETAANLRRLLRRAMHAYQTLNWRLRQIETDTRISLVNLDTLLTDLERRHRAAGTSVTAQELVDALREQLRIGAGEGD